MGDNIGTIVDGQREKSVVPLQGEGRRNAYTKVDIPDGYITWAEHYKIWDQYHKRYPQQSAEDIANRGGFSYKEAESYLNYSPLSWVPRDSRYDEFAREMADMVAETVPEPEPTYDTEKSHIWFVGENVPICESEEDSPEYAVTFDSVDATPCKRCKTKVDHWVKRWFDA